VKGPPSLLLVVPWDLAAPGGVNQVVFNLAREAARHDRLRPIVFCADRSKNSLRVIGERAGVLFANGHLRAPIGARESIADLMMFARSLRSDLRAWRTFIKRHNIQVIDAHYPALNYVVFSLLRRSRRCSLRLLYSLHGTDITALRDYGRTLLNTARWMLHQADDIVCCSRDLATVTQQTLRIREQRVSSIPNGIDIDELEQSRDRGFHPDTGNYHRYLVNVAAYQPSMGQDTLLQAYHRLLHEQLDCALLLIGRSTPQLADLRHQVRQLGLRKQVFFLPDLDRGNTLAAIRQAELLIQPAREDPYGTTLLEAGYLGTPVVATRVGGVPEILGSYYPYLCEPNDPAGLAEVMDAALFNPTETEREVKLIRRRVSTRFSGGTTYNAYEAAWCGST